MKLGRIYIILGAFAVFVVFQDCNKSRDADIFTVASKDLTKIFVGTFNGYSRRTFKHPSFLIDTIPASIVISQVDSTTMRIRFYWDTTFLFENIDTAFADNTIRSLGTDPIDKITDGGRLVGDSIYYGSYRQNMVTFTFIDYYFTGSR